MGVDGRLSLLVARGVWTDLSSPGSLPLLNEMLDRLVPADLQDHGKTRAYLQHIVESQRCRDTPILDPEFLREQHFPENNQAWQGTEKNHKVLLALCREWQVTRARDRVTISFNVMNLRGGVESWTVRLRADKAVRLEGYEVRQFRKDGTFDDALLVRELILSDCKSRTDGIDQPGVNAPDVSEKDDPLWCHVRVRFKGTAALVLMVCGV